MVMLHALSRRAITCACYFELGLRTKPPLPITGMVVCSPNGLQLKAQKIAAASQGRRCGERGPLPALERGAGRENCLVLQMPMLITHPFGDTIARACYFELGPGRGIL
jgi:hypothetical protein